MIDGRVLAIFSALRSSNSNWNDDEWGNCSLHCHNQRVRKKNRIFFIFIRPISSRWFIHFLSAAAHPPIRATKWENDALYTSAFPALPVRPSIRPSVKNTVHRTVHQGHLRIESNRIESTAAAAAAVCVWCVVVDGFSVDDNFLSIFYLRGKRGRSKAEQSRRLTKFWAHESPPSNASAAAAAAAVGRRSTIAFSSRLLHQATTNTHIGGDHQPSCLHEKSITIFYWLLNV